MLMKKIQQILFFILVFVVLTASIVIAAATNTSKPTTITNDGNTTNSYPNATAADGTMQNGSRGYIYNLTITESQPTQKWVGYVGQVVGEYALQDAAANALYDWDIVTITGELYATKEAGYQPDTHEDENLYAGGMPTWADLICANSSMITVEEERFNHSSTDEDSYSKTFVDGAGFNLITFHAGDNEIDDTAIGGGTCFGAHLNVENADQTNNWTQVVLTDLTSQDRSSSDARDVFDITYAAILENYTMGYDGNIYDFQMLLPQSGLQGDQPNVAFYFYIELI